MDVKKKHSRKENLISLFILVVDVYLLGVIDFFDPIIYAVIFYIVNGFWFYRYFKKDEKRE